MALKPQPTVKGYSAWVLGQLVEAKATTLAEVTEWVIDRWVDENRDFLASEFGIKREEFRRQGKVIQYAPRSR